MSLRARIMVGMAWLISLWTVAVIAQTPRVTTPEWPAGKVFFGSDFGFRLDGYDDKVPVGKFVVRVKNRWVEVEEKYEPRVKHTVR
jgi:hypothetical protein